MNEIDEVLAMSPEELMAAPHKRDQLIDYIRATRGSTAKVTKGDDLPVPTIRQLFNKPEFKLRRI